MIPESIRALVSTGPFAHLTTLNPDGSPQVTVVWIGIDGDEFVAGHLSEHRKIKNIRSDGTRRPLLPWQREKSAGLAGRRGGVRHRAHHGGRRRGSAGAVSEDLHRARGRLPASGPAEPARIRRAYPPSPLRRGRTVGEELANPGPREGSRSARSPQRRAPPSWCRCHNRIGARASSPSSDRAAHG
jgi:hypothetical protein